MGSARCTGIAVTSMWLVACTDASSGARGASSGGGAGGASVSSASSTSSGASASASTGSTSSSVGAGGAGGSGPERWLDGYYPGYQASLYPVDAIDFASVTHLMIGRVTPQPDGSLNTTYDIDDVNGPELAHALVDAAHQHGRKAIVMLGGAGEHAGWVGAASDAHRADFIANLVALRAEYGFDGFDLDWEPIDAADEGPFESLATDLRAAAPDALMTVPVGWVTSNAPEISPLYAKVAPLFDQINAMTYGMAGAWPGWQSWHSAALFGETPSTPSSIDVTANAYLAAGIPPGKLGIGMGFYGGCWSSPVTGPNQDLGGSQLVADDGTMSYANVMKTYYDASAAKTDATAQVPYLSFAAPKGPLGCTFVSFDDEPSATAKGAYVVDRGLGGAIVWTINEGYVVDSGQNPLLMALSAGLHASN